MLGNVYLLVRTEKAASGSLEHREEGTSEVPALVWNLGIRTCRL